MLNFSSNYFKESIMLNINQKIRLEADRASLIGGGGGTVDNFRMSGLEVFRNLIPRSHVESLLSDWQSASSSSSDTRVLGFNPVESLDLPSSLVSLSRSKEVLSIVSTIFGYNVGVFKRRVVAKDGSYKGSIFLHQDTGYQRGTMEKASLFIALTDINENSGGLEFLLGTHKFGYLDDAGEIDSGILGDWPRLKPTLKKGDAVLMDSRLWHSSGPNESGLPRVMTDFIYQNGNDASSIEVIDALTGEFEECESLVRYDSPTVFSRSRVKTIQELTKKIDGK